LKIDKLTIVAFSVFLALSILFTVLPDYQIQSIRSSIGSGDVPDYKLTEAIELWQIYKFTVFEPAAFIFYIITVILAVVLIVRLVQLNYTFAPKKPT
jgi:hypothetical protein